LFLGIHQNLEDGWKDGCLQEKQKKVSDFFMKEITLNPFEENSAQLPSLVFLDSF
jgi:hypothetical protein